MVVGGSAVVDVTVVLVGAAVVEVVEVTVVVGSVDEVTVVVLDPLLHGQVSGRFTPVATLRQRSASVALTGSVPVGAHRHSGEHASRRTAARRMKRQSVATGTGPPVIGAPQAGTTGTVVDVVGATVVDVDVDVTVVLVVEVTGTVVLVTVLVVVVVESACARHGCNMNTAAAATRYRVVRCVIVASLALSRMRPADEPGAD